MGSPPARFDLDRRVLDVRVLVLRRWAIR